MNQDWPKITIITPSLNQGQFIEETILSVINQDYHNLEYIIIDGGSTDNTIEVIRKYEKWITYWVSEQDHGQSDAINKGLAKATGLIFNWINSDDLLAPGALQIVGKKFIETRCEVLCGFTKIFEVEKPENERNVRLWVGQNAEETFLYPDNYYQGTYFLLEVIEKLGGVNSSLHYMMDF